MRTNRILGLALMVGLGLVTAEILLSRRRTINFKGRSVVITGGSRGLGLIIARQLAAEGARLTLLARDAAELERAAGEVRAMGAEVRAIPCDISDREAVTQAIETTADTVGRIDVLINNAGVVQVGPLEHLSRADFEEAMGVHLWGPLDATLAALPSMRRQGGGRIVNISSIGGRIAVPHMLPYAASKFALAGLSDGLRAELAKDNILVTTVFPGLMRTGSPFNALFKGRHSGEFTWFSLFDALPISSMDAQRAARQIVEACRVGAPYLTISVQAQLAIRFSQLFPNLTAASMVLMNRLLPAPTDQSGDESRTGWQSQSRWSPSPLTYLSDEAAVANNELSGNAPPV